MSWFNRKAGKRKIKSRIVKKRRFTNPEYILYITRRAGIVFGTLALVIWLGAWFFLSDTAAKVQDWTGQKMLMASADAGFEVKELLVEGRYHADAGSIMAVVGLKKGDPIFAFDPKTVQENIERLDWVSAARVKRILPGTIYIRIQERVPMALWQHNGQVVLIDDKGKRITSSGLGEFKDLIIIVGKDIEDKAPALIADLRAEPDLFYRIETATLVSGRRWDIALKDGTIVKLPEDNTAVALRSLMKLAEEDKIFDKNLESIDIRDLSRITVRTEPGTSEKYETGYQLTSGQGDTI
jgi:cell division protein FtsQ